VKVIDLEGHWLIKILGKTVLFFKWIELQSFLKTEIGGH
jgi:hypothetical protein